MWGQPTADGTGPASGLPIPANPTTLDLSHFLDGPAFRLLPGATLELRNLTLLLPPLSAAPASSVSSPTDPSLIAHVFAAAAAAAATAAAGTPGVASGAPAAGPGASGAAASSVVLRDVVLVAASCSDLYTFTRQLCRPDWWRGTGGAVQVINGSVQFGNGSMRLGAWSSMAATSLTTTGSAATAAATLSHVTAICPEASRLPAAQPYPCSATVVYDGWALRQAAVEMMAVTQSYVLLWLGADVRLGAGGSSSGSNSSGGSGSSSSNSSSSGGGASEWATLLIRQGVSLVLYGGEVIGGSGGRRLGVGVGGAEGSGGRQLDFARKTRTFDVLGYLALYDTTLLGLPYPTVFQQPESLLAVWLHVANVTRPGLSRVTSIIGVAPLTLSRCALLLSEGEAGWWARAAGAGPAELVLQLVPTWRYNLTLLPVAPPINKAAVRVNYFTDIAVRPRMVVYDSLFAPASLYGGSSMVGGDGGDGGAADGAVAAAGVWPLAEMLGPAAALQANLRLYNVLGSEDVGLSLVSRCDFPDTAALQAAAALSTASGGAAGGGGNSISSDSSNTGSSNGSGQQQPRSMLVMVPAQPLPATNDIAVARRSAPGANGTLILAYAPNPELPLLRIAKPCELSAPPAAQAPRRVFWDMRGASSGLGFQPGARLDLSHLTLYNLAPAWPYSPPPAPPSRPPPSPRPFPPPPRPPSPPPPLGPPSAGTVGNLRRSALSDTTASQPEPPPLPLPAAAQPPLATAAPSSPFPLLMPSPSPSPPSPPPPRPPPPLRSPLPSLPPPPPPPPPRPAIANAMAGLSLPLWFFEHDRSASPPLLALRNVTLVLPGWELRLAAGLLAAAGRLGGGGAGAGSSAGAAVGATLGRRLLQAGPEAPGPLAAEADPVEVALAAAARLAGSPTAAAAASAMAPWSGVCALARLLSYAAASEVAWAAPDGSSLRLSRMSHHGWEGRAVTLTAQLPPDAPTESWEQPPAEAVASTVAALTAGCPAADDTGAASPSGSQPRGSQLADKLPLPPQPTALPLGGLGPQSGGGAGTGPAGDVLGPTHGSPSPQPHAGGGGSAAPRSRYHAWAVPVAASVSATVAAAGVVACCAAAVFIRRRRRLTADKVAAAAAPPLVAMPPPADPSCSTDDKGSGAGSERRALALPAAAPLEAGAHSATGAAVAIVLTTPAGGCSVERATGSQVPASAPASPYHAPGLDPGARPATAGPSAAEAGAMAEPQMVQTRAGLGAQAAAAGAETGASLGAPAAEAVRTAWAEYLSARSGEAAAAAAAAALTGMHTGGSWPSGDLGGSGAPTSGAQGAGVPQAGLTKGLAAAIACVQRQLNDPRASGAAEGALRIGGVIGRGAAAVVCGGTWRGLPVAVKSLVVQDFDGPPTHGSSTRRRQRAVLEAAISTALHHPNVVATYAYDIQDLAAAPQPQTPTPATVTVTHGSATTRAAAGLDLGSGASDDSSGGGCSGGEAGSVHRLLLVQELCEGGSLKRALESGILAGVCDGSGGGGDAGREADLVALSLALDIACGLAHMHAAGIVHGDLSSANVLLSPISAPTTAPAPSAIGPSTCAPHASIVPPSAASATASAAACASATGPTDTITASTSQASYAPPSVSGTASPASSSGGAPHGAAADSLAALTAAHQAAKPALQVPAVAKLCDFGLAVRLEGGGTHASGCYQGTPLYMAPEVMEEGRVGPAADVYSLGVLLLDLAAGTAAVARATAAAGMAEAAAEGAAQNTTPAAVLRLMAARCLAPRPRDRPSAAQVAAQLASRLPLPMWPAIEADRPGSNGLAGGHG